MEIGHVVSACNDHPSYMSMIPPFVRAWQTLYPEVLVHIVLVIPHGNPEFRFPEWLQRFILCSSSFAQPRVRFVPMICPPEVSTQFTSQFIRVLYPGMIAPDDKAVLVTDIDMLPMNRTHFKCPHYLGTPIPSDSFVIFRPPTDNQVYICYCAAQPQTWRQVTGIDSWEKLREKLAEVYSSIAPKDRDVHAGPGWYADQNELYNMVVAWDCSRKDCSSKDRKLSFKTRLVILSDFSTGHMRLDSRESHAGTYLHPGYEARIRQGFFTDFHAPKPHIGKTATRTDLIISILQ